MKKQLLSLLAATAFLATAGVTTLNASQGAKKQLSKPFLIQGKLPHLTMMVKILWDDEDVALTPAQKQKLLVVRKETIKQAKSLNKEIIPLEAEIVKASNEGVKPEKLHSKVQHLADLRAKATMVHLECIYKTRNILTKEQLEIIE